MKVIGRKWIPWMKIKLRFNPLSQSIQIVFSGIFDMCCCSHNNKYNIRYIRFSEIIFLGNIPVSNAIADEFNTLYKS